MSFPILTLVCSLGFLLMLTLVGVWHARRIRSGEDFALAGRRLPTFVVFGTLVATWIGTGSIFGNAEFAYGHGAAAFALPIGGALGIAVLACLAGRAREVPADSVPQILRLRFGRAAQLLGAVALIGAYLIIVSYQFRAGAAIVDRIFPGAGDWGVIGFAVFVIFYTMLAGMVSVAWTDLVNGILMAVGILGSLVVLGREFAETDLATLPRVAELAEAVKPVAALGWVGLLLPSLLLVLGDANLYQRFMSASSAAAARRAAVFMFFGVLVMEAAIIALAVLGRQLLPAEPGHHGHVVIDIAFSLVPAWLGVILIVSVVAVIVTTADSYLLGSATSVAADLGGGLGSASGQRWIVLVLGLVAVGLSFTSDAFFRVALYAYTLYGATLTPAVVCALVCPRVPGRAVVTGMAGGLAVALGWKFLLESGVLEGTAAGGIDPVLPALAANVAGLALVSALSRGGVRA